VNVLYVCADRGIPLLGCKGASVHVRSVTSALQSLGHRVTLAVRRIDSGNAAPCVDTIVQLAADPDRAADQLSSLIADVDIDVVIERYSLQSGAARVATRRHGVPLTLEVNAPLVAEASRFRGLADPTAQAWEHDTLRAADRIEVVSSALLRYVGAVAPDVPAAWIPNGADVSAFRNPPLVEHPLLDGRQVVGFSGSMKPWHGVADLLDAFAEISTADAVLLLLGSGPQDEALRRRAAAADLRGRVHFAGQQPHHAVPAWLARFDVAVAPYRPEEGFYFQPLKIVEYLAAGAPIVYPEQGDLPELVGDAGRGYPPGDHSRMTDRIVHLLADDRLRAALSDAATARACRFDWGPIAARVIDFACSPLTPQSRLAGRVSP
jgi:glycosyltransferase involved in cell wall biosynthesis